MALAATMQPARLVLVVVALWGCGFVSQSPQDQRRDWQRRQANALAPAELDRQPARWGRRQTLRARVHVVEGGGRTEAARLAEFEAQVDRANEILVSALDAQIEVVEHRAWQLSSPTADLTTLLPELIARDAGEDVDFVVGLVGASPVATLTFSDLGRAQVLGKHLVLRDMQNAAEVRAFDEGLDTLDADERASLVAKRKRHKETAVLLHEVGHLLGAIHTVDAQWIEHPTYDETAQGYAPQNVEIMRKVLAFRVREDAATADLAQVLREHIDHSDGWSGWVPEEFASFRAGLEPQPQQKAQAAAPPAPPPKARHESDPARDAELLAPEDRPAYNSLLAASPASDIDKTWAAIEALAVKYPNAYPVRRLACETGMRAHISGRLFRPHCRRMMELAREVPATPPAPATPSGASGPAR